MVGGEDPVIPIGGETRRVIATASERLDVALIGKLPCITCGYDLKGASIRSTCPECGTAVRATILWQVDPLADEFKPLPYPKLLAFGLVLWSACALLSALSVWGLRAIDVASLDALQAWRVPWVNQIAVWLAALSGLASLVLIRPSAGIPVWRSICALAASAAYVPLVWSMHRMLIEIDVARSAPYFQDVPRVDRTLLCIVVAASTMIIILGLRPNARELVKRSLVMRTGRVDRQTLLVMAAVMGITLLGHIIRLIAAGAASAGGTADMSLLMVIGTMIVGLGSGLFTLGLISAMIDSWRISRAIRIPAPSPRQIFGVTKTPSSISLRVPPESSITLLPPTDR